MNIDVPGFRQSGYTLLPGLMHPADVSATLAYFHDLDAHGAPAGLEPEYDVAGTQRRLRKLRRILWNDLGLWGPLLKRAGVVSIADALLGKSAAIVFHAAFLKPARFGTPVALHQDQALWRYQYPGAFSIWFALTSVEPGNGGLYGCPGSQRDGLVPHEDRAEYPWHPSVDPHLPGLAQPQQFSLSPGDAVLWDRYFVHGSGPNTSPSDRIGTVVVVCDTSTPGFMATDSFPIDEIRAVAT